MQWRGVCWPAGLQFRICPAGFAFAFTALELVLELEDGVAAAAAAV